MGAYRFCEECGAALDPGERCDCQETGPLKSTRPERYIRMRVEATRPVRAAGTANTNGAQASGKGTKNA